MNKTIDRTIGGWRKSSRSNGSGQNCVEVGHGDRVFAVRDTKDRAGGTLIVSDQTWLAFLTDIRRGRFDLGRTRP